MRSAIRNDTLAESDVVIGGYDERRSQETIMDTAVATGPIVNPIAVDAPRPRLSVTIPCYNEEAGLPELYRRLTAACREVVGDDYEVILVNDGSARDDTWGAIGRLAETDTHVIGIDLSRNFGHQAALTAGYDAAQGEAVISMDADLQDPPEVVERMVERWKMGFEVVYGVRTRRLGEGLFKKISAWIFYRLLAALSERAVPVDCGDFRLLDRQVVQAMRQLREQNRYLRGLVAWLGFRHCAVTYERAERVAGTTSFTCRRMVRLAHDALLSCTHLPGRVALVAGIILFSGALVGALGMGLLSLGGRAPAACAAPVLIACMSGVHCIVLSIILDAMQRLLDEARRRPLYVLRAGPGPRSTPPGTGPSMRRSARPPPRGAARPSRDAMTAVAPFGSRAALGHR